MQHVLVDGPDSKQSEMCSLEAREGIWIFHAWNILTTGSPVGKAQTGLPEVLSVSSPASLTLGLKSPSRWKGEWGRRLGPPWFQRSSFIYGFLLVVALSLCLVPQDRWGWRAALGVVDMQISWSSWLSLLPPHPILLPFLPGELTGNIGAWCCGGLKAP